ncbi:MAG: hypothetical protein DRN37_02470 [Thermoplasmata archaeon]|nr:MAG: hypothetical protein DRN37_02470 [Thermoplasmata archaeon]
MSKLIGKDQWVWVVVQDPGGDEQFLGQYDQEKDESFIPLFLEKDEAQQALDRLQRKEGSEYEVQAIEFGELRRSAAENRFMLFVLDGAGAILEKIRP